MKPNEDYAGLIAWLRNKAESLSEIYPPEAEAADALEALLAKLNNKPKPSEDYAGLVARLKNLACELASVNDAVGERCVEINEAADALEAVLAERDALKAERDADRAHRVLAAELHAAGMSTQRDIAIRERDALKAELAKAQEIARVQAERIGWYINKQEKRDAVLKPRKSLAEAAAKERDALLARLAPVDDKELEAKAAAAIIAVEHNGIDDEFILEARAAIAAIRPHIEAAAYEDAARFIEENVFNYSSGDQNYWSHRKGDNTHGLEYAREFREKAAVIRSGK